jgi:hypothetical protein
LSFCEVVHIIQEPVVGIVEQFVLLLFLHTLDQQAQLLTNLIVGVAEQIGDAGMNIENGIDAAEPVFAGLFEILNKGGSERRLVRVVAGRFDRLGLIDLVDPEGAGLKRLPIQKPNQPARCNGSELRSSLGYICKLKCSIFV